MASDNIEHWQMPQPDHEPELSAFRQRYVDSMAKYQYLKLDTSEAKDQFSYIPRQAVEDYLLSPAHIQAIINKLFDARGYDPRLPKKVEQRYRAVFSILLWIHRGDLIKEFVRREEYSDDRLPILTKPHFLDEESWQKFEDTQSHFCIWTFKGECSYPTKYHIIPYTDVRLLSNKGSTADIFEVEIPAQYVELLPQGSTRSHQSRVRKPSQSGIRTGFQHKRFAVKRFKKSEHFNKESEVYALIRSRLQQGYPRGLIEFLDCYETPDGQEQCILFALAAGGTLEELFERHPPPKTSEEINELWSRLFDLLQGLIRLHESGAKQEARVDVAANKQCVHQDIHLGNIVLSERQDALQQQNYALRNDYMLVDLGHASLAVQKHADQPTEHRNNRTNNEFAAPESYTKNSITGNSIQMVTPAIDIFSLGAVYLVAAVWIALGQKGVEEFLFLIQDEWLSVLRQQGCHFHTANWPKTELLDVVNNYLTGRRLESRISREDKTTKRVLKEVIEPMMRVAFKERPPARDLFEIADGIVNDIRTELRPSEHSLNRGLSPGHRIDKIHDSDLESSDEDGDQYQGQNQSQDLNRRPTLTGRRHDRQTSLSSELLTQERALEVYDNNHPRWRAWIQRIRGTEWHQLPQQKKLQYLRERDFIFLVDTSTSMQDYSSTMESTFRAMCYITQLADDNGVELFFTDAAEGKRSTKTDSLVKLLKRRQFTEAANMSQRLGHILELCRERLTDDPRYKGDNPQSRGISIYILTDGCWKDPEAMEMLIRENAEFLKNRNWGRKELNMSFINFAGRQSIGAQRMQDLDDLEEVARDVVDTSHHEDEFVKLLLGGLSAEFDQKNKKEDRRPMPHARSSSHMQRKS